MALPKSSTLSKVTVLISVVALALYCVGGLITRWLKGNFMLPSPPMPVAMEYEVHMGLRQTCVEAAPVLGGPTNKYCRSGEARDWQKIAAGVALVGGIASAVCLILAIVNITCSKAQVVALKVAMTICGLIAATGMTIALLLYGLNKERQVSPPLPLMVDFDINWAFIVSAVSCGIHLLLALVVIWDWRSGAGFQEGDKQYGQPMTNVY